MNNNFQENYIGASIISNTQLFVANNFFDDRHYSYSKIFRSPNIKDDLTELSNLIDAIVLNEQLYTLPATDSYHRDGYITRELYSNRILRTDILSGIGPLIVELIFKKISGIKEWGLNEQEMFDVLARQDKFSSEIYQTGRDSPMIIYQDSLLPKDINPIQNLYKTLETCTFDELLLALKEYYQLSHELDVDLINLLRNMHYICSAEFLNVTYLPPLSRLDFTQKVTDTTSKFRYQLYEKISQALNVTIDEVFEDFKPKVSYVPPFAAIVLDRSENRDQIMQCTLELRDEFAKTRKHFDDLERESRATMKIKERIKIKNLQSQLLEDASKLFKLTPTHVKLQKTIKFIPELVKPITNPTDPTNYSADLATTPLEVMTAWWRKRPLNKMFSLKDKIFAIEAYPHLIRKHFPELE